ncbi:phage tail tape measure protein [Pseudomonas sp. HK3]
MNHIEELEFILSLTDQVTGPVNKVMGSISKFTKKASAGFNTVKNGAIGLAATGALLVGGLQPAIAMDRALGEVKSLGVRQEALDHLSQTSLQFTTQYGGDATEFVKSSYDIQSAIAGLENTDLSAFTQQSNLLAKATKSDAGTITDYVGTMYGIFEKQAVQMGKANWIAGLTGQTATAVQMFKTTGGEMAGAFSSLGAEATSAQVAMSEQMAILGQLQSTMSGSEAGTKYRAFLAGVGKAQAALGLQFTDTQGRMLSMPKILDEIRGKFGDIDTVSKSDALAKAFGSQEAVGLVKLLSANTDALKGNIGELAKQTDETKAAMMAQAQVDPWERASGGINALRVAIGATLLPIINPLISGFADASARMQAWTQRFPNLTRLLGFTILGFTVLAAVMAVFTIGVGLATAAWAALGTAFSVVVGLLSIIFSPIGILIAAIIALVVYWDDLKAAFGDNAVFKFVEDALSGIAGMLESLTEIEPFAALKESFDWLDKKLASLDGFEFDGFGFFSSDDENIENNKKKISESASKINEPDLFKPKTTLNSSTQNNSGTVVENMTVNTSQNINPDSLAHMIGMGA